MRSVTRRRRARLIEEPSRRPGDWCRPSARSPWRMRIRVQDQALLPLRHAVRRAAERPRPERVAQARARRSPTRESSPSSCSRRSARSLRSTPTWFDSPTRRCRSACGFREAADDDWPGLVDEDQGRRYRAVLHADLVGRPVEPHAAGDRAARRPRRGIQRERPQRHQGQGGRHRDHRQRGRRAQRDGQHHDGAELDGLHAAARVRRVLGGRGRAADLAGHATSARRTWPRCTWPRISPRTSSTTRGC